MKAKFTVLVTGIGGNVGQGICKNLRLHYGLDVKIVGTNIEEKTAGRYLVDAFHLVVRADHPDYLKAIKDLVTQEAVDLILPATDLESYLLSDGELFAQGKVLTSPLSTQLCFYDKLKTYELFHSLNLNFPKTYLPSSFDKNSADHLILKQRSGGGSKNLFLKPTLQQIKDADDEFVIQEKLTGIEITSTCFYPEKGAVIGPITFIRDLKFGTTFYCKRVKEYDEEVLGIFKKMGSKVKIRGSINLQSIVTDKGVFPFEINGRISGTNSIRSHLGFSDVKFSVDSYLLKKEIETPQILDGEGYRIISDIIIPEGHPQPIFY